MNSIPKYVFVIIGVLVLIVAAEGAFLFLGRDKKITPITSLNVERNISSPSPMPLGGEKTFQRDKLENKISVFDPASEIYGVLPLLTESKLTMTYSGTVKGLGMQEPTGPGQSFSYVITIVDAQGRQLNAYPSQGELSNSELIGVNELTEIKPGDKIEITSVTNLLDSSPEDKLILKVIK